MKALRASFEAQKPWCLKLVSVIMGSICVELFLIFLVLKLDDHTEVGKWHWSAITIPPLATAFAFLLLWTFVHYQQAGGDIVNVRWNMELVRQHLNNCDVDQIEQYHERYIFRDLIIMVSYIVATAYGAILSASPCRRNCDTPFGMLAVGVIIINVLRLLFCGMRMYFEYYRLREMCTEIRYFKSWRDEKRLREHVAPSLSLRFGFNVYSVFEAACFVSLMIFVLMGTVWVENGLCQDTCSKGYHLTKYLVVGIFMFESLYLLSVVALAFFKRSLGVEKVENIIAWILADNNRRRELKREKAKAAAGQKDEI